MSGLRFYILFALLSFPAWADPSGHGHDHSTSVADSGPLSLEQAASQAPASLLQGTSFEGAAAQPAQIAPLQQANQVAGDGYGVMRMEDRIGRPGEAMPGRGSAYGAVPRTPVYWDRD